jgi:small conductance mechanosensitive channel
MNPDSLALSDSLTTAETPSEQLMRLDWSTISGALLTWVPVALRIVLILALGWGLWWVTSRLINRLGEQMEAHGRGVSQRAQTLTRLLQSALGVAFITILITLVLGELGINLGPILAAAGVVGLAIGFGAQSLVKDVINGFFFLLEGHVRVGDVIDAGGKIGLAENITLRTLLLRDFEGRLHVIPHGEITTVTNYSKDYSRCVIEVGVAYREDHEFVMQLLREEAEALRNEAEFSEVILEEAEVFGIDAFNSSDILFKVRFKTQPLQQWNVARVFRRRIKSRFDREGVEIPFPHRTLYFGMEKDGSAPPAYVRLLERAQAQQSQTTTSPSQGENENRDESGAEPPPPLPDA